MAAYILATFEITDPETYARYVSDVVPLIAKHGGEILVADRAGETLEGRPAPVTVILKFPSQEAARAWYDDPAYVPVRQIRFDCTKGASLALLKELPKHRREW
ncbi:MAG: DUF1330 domain-containing protein [Bryobacterales bacterium]